MATVHTLAWWLATPASVGRELCPVKVVQEGGNAARPTRSKGERVYPLPKLVRCTWHNLRVALGIVQPRVGLDKATRRTWQGPKGEAKNPRGPICGW